MENKDLNNIKSKNNSQQKPKQAHNLLSGKVADGIGNLAKPSPDAIILTKTSQNRRKEKSK